MTSLFHVLPTASRPRRTHDRILASILTLSLVGLVVELLLRINDLLPLLPRLDFSVAMFSFFVTLGIGGTLWLALTSPAESHETAYVPRGTERDLRGVRPAPPVGATATERDATGDVEVDDADERELVAA